MSDAHTRLHVDIIVRSITALCQLAGDIASSAQVILPARTFDNTAEHHGEGPWGFSFQTGSVTFVRLTEP